MIHRRSYPLSLGPTNTQRSFVSYRTFRRRGRPGERHIDSGTSSSLPSPTPGSSAYKRSTLQANEILRIREKMFDLYADHCKFRDEDRETARKRFGSPPSRLALEPLVDLS